MRPFRCFIKTSLPELEFYMRKVFLLIATLFFLTACKMQMEPLTVGKVENVKVSKISLKGIEGEVSLKITNPNNIGFNVYPSYVDALFSGITLGRAETKQKVFIPAKSDLVHSFYFKGDFKNMGISDYTQLIGGKLGNIELKGKLKAGKWFYRKSFDVSHSQRISFGK